MTYATRAHPQPLVLLPSYVRWQRAQADSLSGRTPPTEESSVPTPHEYSIEDKIFVAVGAARGIGRGVVEVLAEAGADGAVTALTPIHVLPLAERLAKRTGRRLLGLVADGTSTAAMEAVLEQVLQEFGRIDIWVNAVGDAIPSPLVPLPTQGQAQPRSEPVTDTTMRQVLDINLASVVIGCRTIGRYFVERGHGRIINIGSFAGSRGGANISLYTAAKAGVEGLTRALALEWAPYGVTVNCISPGSFPDPEHLAPEALARNDERLRATVPLRRGGNPREVGLLALYLASDAAAYMTGQSINLDGGSTL